MKKFFSPLALLVLIPVLLFALSACKNEKKTIFDALATDSNTRDLIVVISDLHLGADLQYAEINNNRKPLAVFLEQIRLSDCVKELVINGDFIDEWYIPSTTNTYNGKDQADFAQRIADTNKEVFDQLKQIIQEQKVLVTYVPGNHDLAITESTIQHILPGINQARDTKGLGTYSPVDHPEIAIEHGHRYNIMCAPDPLSNQDIAPSTILPTGYFLTRIAALHLTQGCKQNTDTIPSILLKPEADPNQAFLYGYWKLWSWWLNKFPTENSFAEKTIVTHVDGFTDTISIKELLPYQEPNGGDIQVKLFNGVQNNWANRSTLNHVPVPISLHDAIEFAASAVGTDTMAVVQYFANPISTKRIVVFGHTHEAKLTEYTTHNGQKAIYVNSGTWIDQNKDGDTLMDFVVIAPQNSSDANSTTRVALYNFMNEVVTETAKDSVRL